jgi:hypothetical protein
MLGRGGKAMAENDIVYRLGWALYWVGVTLAVLWLFGVASSILWLWTATMSAVS